MTPEFFMQLLAIGGVGIGVYSAIRVDLAVLHEKFLHHERRLTRLEKDDDENHF